MILSIITYGLTYVNKYGHICTKIIDITIQKANIMSLAPEILERIRNNNPTTLQTLDLAGNNAIALAEALKTNYTLLELNDIESPEITKYLERNRAIANYLKPIHDFNEKNERDLDEINEKIDLLTQKAPELLDETNPLPSTHYLAENYRLLIALSHLSGNNPNGVIQCLETPFIPIANQVAIGIYGLPLWLAASSKHTSPPS